MKYSSSIALVQPSACFCLGPEYFGFLFGRTFSMGGKVDQNMFWKGFRVGCDGQSQVVAFRYGQGHGTAAPQSERIAVVIPGINGVI